MIRGYEDRDLEALLSVWEKFVFLTASSAVTAVTRQTIGTVRANPVTRALLRDAMDEGVALAIFAEGATTSA